MRRPTRFDLLLVLALAVFVILALTALRRTDPTAQAWLAAYVFWAGLPIGASYLVLVHALSGGQWGLTLRPALVAMLRTTPLLALLLVPVLFGARHIFSWAAAGEKGWLALPAFVARSVIYVVLWNVIALGALRRTRADGWLSPGFAWPALILLFASTTVAAFDWLMSLEPHWTSTIYGLLVSAGWVVSALAAALAVAAACMASDAVEALDAPARILLALIYLWGYLAVVQLVVIWESNLSREIPWYLRRSVQGWEWVAVAIAVWEFALPFLILIWQPLRRMRSAVLAAALSIIAGRIAETWWLTVPDFGRGYGWVDPLAMIGIGAAFLYVGGRDIDLRPLRHARTGDAAN